MKYRSSLVEGDNLVFCFSKMLSVLCAIEKRCSLNDYNLYCTYSCL